MTHIRNLKVYRIWRDKVLERDHYTCQDCGSFGGPLDVHHIVPFAEDVNGRFDPDNGIALCPLCHGKRHGHPGGFVRVKASGCTEERRVITIGKEDYWKLKKIAELKGVHIRKVVDEVFKRYFEDYGNVRLRKSLMEVFNIDASQKLYNLLT